MSRFCAKCGRLDSGYMPFIGNLCIKCYLEENRAVSTPREITLYICKGCLSYKFKGKWISSLNHASFEEIIFEAIMKEIQSKTKINLSEVQIRLNIEIPEIGHNIQFPVIVEAQISKDDFVTFQKNLVNVKINFVLCPQCSMRVSKTYKAMVQVRSAKLYLDPRDKRIVKKILQEFDQRNIIEIEEVREGINIKTADSSTARIIASRIKQITGAQLYESHEHVRRNRKGRKTAKLIVVARLPKFKEDDMIIYNDKVFRIFKISKNNIVLLNEVTKEKLSVSINALWNGSFKEIPEDSTYVRLIVVGKDDRVVYAINLNKNYEMVEIPLAQLPEKVEAGDELKTLIINGKPYVLGKA